MTARNLAWHMESLKRRLAAGATPKGECVIWTGAVSKNGYGKIRQGHRHLSTHRAAWLVHFGEIPAGLCVCHKCDVRNCINPDHLWLGTTADNTRDMDDKGRRRTPHGENHHSRRHPERIPRGEAASGAKLTAADIPAIRELAGFATYQEISTMFSVSQGTVSEIVTRKLWSHIP